MDDILEKGKDIMNDPGQIGDYLNDPSKILSLIGQEGKNSDIIVMSSWCDYQTIICISVHLIPLMTNL